MLTIILSNKPIVSSAFKSVSNIINLVPSIWSYRLRRTKLDGTDEVVFDRIGETDRNPRFTFNGLVAGEEYIIYVDPEGPGYGEQSRNQRTSKKPKNLMFVTVSLWSSG